MTSTSSVSSTSATATTTATTAATTAAADSATVGSQIVTSLGLGTGIDMTNLATQIANATFMNQNNALTSQLSQMQVQISEASQLKSDVNSLVSSFASLVNGGALASTPTVTNSAVATATLPDGESGPSSGYTLEVSKLASAQVLSSTTYASSSATTGSGTLTIQFGSIASGSFTADSSKSAVNVTIAQGATLSDVATAINASGAGISAYVATTATGAQLVMKGPTGANNAFTLSATENSSDPGLSSLAWTPATGASARLAQSAGDAAFNIDGIAHTSASNTITDAAPGLSLVLTGTNSGSPTTITYSNPSTSISTAMTNLTTALNSIATELGTDMTPASGGSLTNDSGAQLLSRKLAALAGTVIMPHAAAGEPSTLADLGLTIAKDGSFTLNTTTLQTALTNHPSAVAAMFTNGLYGVYGTLSDIGMAVTSSSDPGSLSGSVMQYTTRQTALTTQQTDIANQQAALRTQLITQLSTANANVATSNSTLTFLKNQIAAWNKTGN